jgi:hypothetical protein
MNDEDLEIEAVPARRPTAEEQYYHEMSHKDPVETTTRIEETAKYLLGIIAGISGVYLSAYQLSIGKTPVTNFWCFLPMILLILVIFPQKYETLKDEPASLKKAVLSARDRKYRRLFAGTFLFIIGIISAVFAFG